MVCMGENGKARVLMSQNGVDAGEVDLGPSEVTPQQAHGAPPTTEHGEHAQGDDSARESVAKSPFCSPPDLFEDVTEVLRRISVARGRPLFALVSDRIDPSVPDQVYRWRKYLKEVGKNNNLDVLIHSPGGHLTSCYRTARLIARYTDCWEALVPGYAASGATLICLGSSNIVLPDVAPLGPVDPQVLSKRPTRFFSIERQSPLEAFQAGKYLREFALSTLNASMYFLVAEQHVAPQTALETASKLAVQLAQPILEKIEPYDLGAFDLDSNLALNYCRRIADPSEVKKQTQRRAKYSELVERYPAHEFAVDISEAQALGLTVSEPNEDLEDLFEELGPLLDQLETYIGLVTTN